MDAIIAILIFLIVIVVLGGIGVILYGLYRRDSNPSLEPIFPLKDPLRINGVDYFAFTTAIKYTWTGTDRDSDVLNLYASTSPIKFNPDGTPIQGKTKIFTAGPVPSTIKELTVEGLTVYVSYNTYLVVTNPSENGFYAFNAVLRTSPAIIPVLPDGPIPLQNPLIPLEDPLNPILGPLIPLGIPDFFPVNPIRDKYLIYATDSPGGFISLVDTDKVEYLKDGFDKNIWVYDNGVLCSVPVASSNLTCSSRSTVMYNDNGTLAAGIKSTLDPKVYTWQYNARAKNFWCLTDSPDTCFTYSPETTSGSTNTIISVTTNPSTWTNTFV